MTIRITASRHSAFYSPLISTMAAGFLEKHGLEFSYAVLAPGETAAGLIREGKTDVMQSAPSTNWAKMEKGETGFPLHFALINRRDGFFLVERGPRAGRESIGSAFNWKQLEGKALLADHGSQPLAMLRYALQFNGVEERKVHILNAGSAEEMALQFRAGEGNFVHLQAPAPQLLEQDGIGWTVASVGASMPPNAFSTLCASREFISGETCRAFVKAFAEAKEWVRQTPAEEIAAKEFPWFPGVGIVPLTEAISQYKSIGTWNGGIEIPRDLYEQSLNVFESTGGIKHRQPWDAVCVSPG
jgi:NitT/TauT family transport system substrate-binding protein